MIVFYISLGDIFNVIFAKKNSYTGCVLIKIEDKDNANGKKCKPFSLTCNQWA